ncbi:MAG TPA: methyltransferase domain-containing protein [Candidatus Limnocylindrales bacterium]|nr:methyltransferase domain-containing protein [Candidatus Limnocylindrales bacterium]
MVGVMCPACALTSLTPLADLGGMPVACGNTFPTPMQARLSPRGQMLLASCASCGHVANIAFDASLARFDATFEAALFHSPTYTDYATGVVERLVKRYSLEGRRVLEIASGATVLVDRLASLGCEASGVPDTTVHASDFVLARFVLEHLADPYALLREMRKHATHAFIEVPDAGYDLTTAGWDCIYPHVGYFSASSLSALLARAGWAVLEMGTAFNDQYLWAEVGSIGLSNLDTLPAPSFEPRFAEATAHWRAFLPGRRAVVWGAGTRGTMFCNRVDPAGTLLEGVVDRNPAKHGRYLPLAGHRVLSPTELPSLRPDTVVLTNPAYRNEIAAELASLGLHPDVLVA